MKLFTIPITTGPHAGKELVGTRLPDRTENKTVEVYHKRTIFGKMVPVEVSVWDNLIGKKVIINPLSDITEEQAKELGFGPDEKRTTRWSAKERLISTIVAKIMAEGTHTHTKDDLSDILLILVEP